MPDIIVSITPKTTVQVERRCSLAACLNNLDDTSGDPLAKYQVQLTLWDEPQDANGDQTGPRTLVGTRTIPLQEVMSRNFTSNGVTIPGGLVLALFNEVIDAYKGD